MWKTKEAKCVVDFSQSLNNIKGVGLTADPIHIVCKIW